MQYDYLEPLVKDLSLYKIKTEINMKNLRICQTFSLWLVLLATSLSLSAQTTLLDKLGKITEINPWNLQSLLRNMWLISPSR